MEMDTAMELSFWKEEPLSPVFSGLEEQTDVWQLFEEDVAKQAQSPLGDSGSSGKWLPESPGDSCESFDSMHFSLQSRAQLASQLLQDLDEVLIKEEPFSDWYETKTDLPMFEELPSPTPSLSKDEVGAVSRPFAGLNIPLNVPYNTPAYATPQPPAAVLVPLATVQQEVHPTDDLQQLTHTVAANNNNNSLGLLALVQQPQHHHQPQQHQLQHHQQHHQQQHFFADTQTLLDEFECVYGKVEQSHGGALTPPQSPPHQINPYPVNAYHHQQQQQPQQSHPQQPHLQQQQLLVPQSSYTLEQQQQQQLILEVDEIACHPVQVQQEASWPQVTFASSSLASLAPPSPCTSSNSSSSSSSCFSDSPAPASPETDDPEWLPGASPEPAASASPARASSSKAASSRKRGAARRKPYAPSVEDKRMRKKEQNKNAATRYRMKKKAEVEEILGEENELKQKNEELQAKHAELAQEIRYLKNLMRDLFRAKGLIK